MLNRFARAFFTRLLTPVARGLLRLRLRPDAVTESVAQRGLPAGTVVARKSLG